MSKKRRYCIFASERSDAECRSSYHSKRTTPFKGSWGYKCILFKIQRITQTVL